MPVGPPGITTIVEGREVAFISAVSRVRIPSKETGRHRSHSLLLGLRVRGPSGDSARGDQQ